MIPVRATTRRYGMRIEINDLESQVLRDTLDSVLTDLGMDIADTDARDSRDQWKAKRELLSVIREKLDSLGASDEPH